MNERLMFFADELRDAANDVAAVNELATDDAARRIARVAEDLRALAYDPRYDVEGCDDQKKNSRGPIETTLDFGRRLVPLKSK